MATEKDDADGMGIQTGRLMRGDKTTSPPKWWAYAVPVDTRTNRVVWTGARIQRDFRGPPGRAVRLVEIGAGVCEFATAGIATPFSGSGSAIRLCNPIEVSPAEATIVGLPSSGVTERPTTSSTSEVC